MSLGKMIALTGSAALLPISTSEENEMIDEPAEPVVMRRASVAPEPGAHRLDGGNVAIFAFALAGNARFTLVSKKTGARFTYRVRAKKIADGPRAGQVDCYFVSVLVGPNNGADYEYLGTIFAKERVRTGGGSFGPVFEMLAADQPKFVRGKKSRVGPDAPSAKAFAWWWDRTTRAMDDAEQVEVWHLGKCGRCGRDLTVPESIACGLGPECASKREDGR